MNYEGHARGFIYFWIGALIWRLIIEQVNWYLFAGMIFGFIVSNPDLDIVIEKIIHKTIHRWWITHSVILPIILYWSIHPYLNMETAKEFGFILFLPIIIHLLLDFKIENLLMDEAHGKWQISIYPFKWKGSYRLGEKLSYIWMVMNVISVIIYAFVIYEVWNIFI